MFMPAIERFAAQLPLLRGLHLRGSERWPHIAGWLAALDARPSYQQVKTKPRFFLSF